MPRGQYDRSVLRRQPEAEVANGERVESSRPIRLLEAHGFINEYDAVYFKPQGALITNPVEIAMLRERGAVLEYV